MSPSPEWTTISAVAEPAYADRSPCEPAQSLAENHAIAIGAIDAIDDGSAISSIGSADVCEKAIPVSPIHAGFQS